MACFFSEAPLLCLYYLVNNFSSSAQLHWYGSCKVLIIPGISP
uniref:Uncharacterized protein n=1 Tax=Arundo donax TaxID=35708 RepID=A0A0A8XZX7_ARUDO